MCFLLQDDLKTPDFSLANTAFFALMHQSIKIIQDKGFQSILQLFTPISVSRQVRLPQSVRSECAMNHQPMMMKSDAVKMGKRAWAEITSEGKQALNLLSVAICTPGDVPAPSISYESDPLLLLQTILVLLLVASAITLAVLEPAIDSNWLTPIPLIES